MPEAEKSKTGFQNKVCLLVALHLTGQTVLLEQELKKLSSFGPIQASLRKLIEAYNQMGATAFYALGYLPWPKRGS